MLCTKNVQNNKITNMFLRNAPSALQSLPNICSFYIFIAAKEMCMVSHPLKLLILKNKLTIEPRGGGGGSPLYGLNGDVRQPGEVFRDFCLKQGIDFIIFCLKQGIFSWTINSLPICSTDYI